MFQAIIDGMLNGNFSFLILAVGVIQTVLMVITLTRTRKKP